MRERRTRERGCGSAGTARNSPASERAPAHRTQDRTHPQLHGLHTDVHSGGHGRGGRARGRPQPHPRHGRQPRRLDGHDNGNRVRTRTRQQQGRRCHCQEQQLGQRLRLLAAPGRRHRLLVSRHERRRGSCDGRKERPAG